MTEFENQIQSQDQRCDHYELQEDTWIVQLGSREEMKSHEKTQSEANQHEDQEEDTDILVVPIRFVIRKFIAGHRMLYSQWFLRIAAAVQPIGRTS